MVCDHAHQMGCKATAQKEYVWLWIQVSWILSKAMRRFPDIKFHEEIVCNFGLELPSTIYGNFIMGFGRTLQNSVEFLKISMMSTGKVTLTFTSDHWLHFRLVYGNINFSKWGILSGYNIHQINFLIGNIIFNFTLYLDLLFGTILNKNKTH